MDGEQVADVDIISNLPMEIIDAILIRMPLKDAVRTSILSNKWRHKWVTISHLVFGSSFNRLGDYEWHDLPERIINHHHHPVVSVIDQVLLRHQGSVSKFELAASISSFSRIDRWMLYLSSKGIKELMITLCTYIFEHYRIPTSLFQFRELTRLDLGACTLKLPPTFDGFPFLKTLNLKEVEFVSCIADNLISKCTLLERLQLISCEPRCEKINAPGLKFLRVFGEFEPLTLENTTLLESAHVVLCHKNKRGQHANACACNCFRVPCHLPNIRKLAMRFSGYYCKVPLFLFSFQELTDLHLSRCTFQPPSTFEGFPSLRRLGIFDVNFVNCNVDILILKSPLLEMLELFTIDHSRMKSNGPKIKKIAHWRF